MPTDQFGKYELLDRIAAGGMAEIFKARYAPAQGVTKTVVIKKILPSYEANQNFINRFTNEARIAMGLSHGNIVHVFDFGELEGTPFLAMEFVDGQPLSKLSKRAKASGIPALPPEFASYIVAEALKGLHHAHTRLDEQGRPLHIVHRDVSPQNVLISYEGQVKLVDFGIARINASRLDSDPHVPKGKYVYFAPEQARGREVDARTDVFGTGVVLYELLTGQLPFQGTFDEVVNNVVRGAFSRPRDVWGEVPFELERITLKAMSLEPDERYQTAEAFGHDLTRYLSSSHPDFTPTDLASLLQLLFEQELVAEGRPVRVPASFIQSARQYRRAPSVPSQDGLESAPLKHAERSVEEHEPATDTSRVVPQPHAEAATTPNGSVTGARRASAATTKEPSLQRGSSMGRTAVLGVAAALAGFVLVFLLIKYTHGSMQVHSTPPGATVHLDDERVPQQTPFRLANLRSGKTYRLEVTAPGFITWRDEVPLAGGEERIIEVALKAEAPPEPIIEEVAVTAEPEPPPPPVVAQVPDTVSWPIATLQVDVSRHRIDLKRAGAATLALDPKQATKVSMARGATGTWMFSAVNAAGAQSGLLGTTPLLLRGATSLYVFRVPAAFSSGTKVSEDAKPRQLVVQVGRARAKQLTVRPALSASAMNAVTLSGLSAKSSYQLTVHKPPDSALTSAMIGAPRQGVIIAPMEQPVVISGVDHLRLFVVDDADAPAPSRLLVDVKEIAKRRRR